MNTTPIDEPIDTVAPWRDEDEGASSQQPNENRALPVYVNEFMQNWQMEHSNDAGSDESGEESATYEPVYVKKFMQRKLMEAMPDSFKNRITALKNIQLEHLEIDAKFFKDVYKLEMQYHEMHKPLYEVRKTIVSGEHEPAVQKPLWGGRQREGLDDASDAKYVMPHVVEKIEKMPEDAKGVPEFWLTVFHSIKMLWARVEDHDEPALKKLIDINVVYEDEYSFTFQFHFAENEYFTNSLLTKQYFLNTGIDKKNPFNFDGHEIYKCKGCEIKWHRMKNLTVKLIKKQERDEHGSIRCGLELVQAASFFHFFQPPEVVPGDKGMSDEVRRILAADFELGHFLRVKIIPKAVLFYTGDLEDSDEGEDSDGNVTEIEDDDTEAGGDADAEDTAESEVGAIALPKVAELPEDDSGEISEDEAEADSDMYFS